MLEETASLDEERAFLRVEGFVRREVENRGVGFDLAEVRLHRSVQGEIGSDAVLEVETEVLEAVELVRRTRDSRIGGAVDGVGEQFDLSRRGDFTQSRQGAEAADEAGKILIPRGPGIVLAARLHPAAYLDPPGVVASAIANGREGNAHLRVPAVLIAVGLRLPDGVPVGIGVSVVVDVAILLDALRVDPEVVAGRLVVIRVDEDADEIAVDEAVAPESELAILSQSRSRHATAK